MATLIKQSTTHYEHPQNNKGLWGKLKGLMALRRERAALAQLDAHLLKDIGISAASARKESQKPLWDAPQRWRL